MHLPPIAVNVLSIAHSHEPWTCPFCGYEVDDEEDIDREVPDEAEHDSWN